MVMPSATASRMSSPAWTAFSATQTMSRYQTEFYEPLVADWSNFGTWTEKGAPDASSRATGIWQQILAQDNAPPVNPDRLAALTDYIRKASAAGGAPPVS